MVLIQWIKSLRFNLFIFLQLSAGNLCAQFVLEPSVTILCLDQELNTPIEQVEVILDQKSLGFTNNQGLFSYERESLVGRDSLYLNHPSYHVSQKVVDSTGFYLIALRSKYKTYAAVDVISMDYKKYLKKHQKDLWPTYTALYKYQEQVFDDSNRLVYTKKMIVTIQDEGGKDDGSILKPIEKIMIHAMWDSLYPSSSFYLNHESNFHNSKIQQLRGFNYYRNSKGFMNKSKLDHYNAFSYKIQDSLYTDFSHSDSLNFSLGNLPYGNGQLVHVNKVIKRFKLIFPYRQLSADFKELKLYKARKFNEFPLITLNSNLNINYDSREKLVLPVAYTFHTYFVLIDKKEDEFKHFKSIQTLDLVELLDPNTRITEEKVNVFGYFKNTPFYPKSHPLLKE